MPSAGHRIYSRWRESYFNCSRFSVRRPISLQAQDPTAEKPKSLRARGAARESCFRIRINFWVVRSGSALSSRSLPGGNRLSLSLPPLLSSQISNQHGRRLLPRHRGFHGRRPPDGDVRWPDGSNVRPHPVHVQMGNSRVSAPGDSHGGRAPALVGLMGGWVGSVFYVCITDDISHQGKRKLSQPPLVFRISCVPSFFF